MPEHSQGTSVHTAMQETGEAGGSNMNATSTLLYKWEGRAYL